MYYIYSALCRTWMHFPLVVCCYTNVHVYLGLMNALATREGYPKATWYELWQELQESASNSRPVSPVSHVTYSLKSCDRFLARGLYKYDIVVSSYFL